MNLQIRIALACFIGGCLGALIALYMNQDIWWIGIIIGGIIGYISYVTPEIPAAVRHLLRTDLREVAGSILGFVVLWLRACAFTGVALTAIMITVFSIHNSHSFSASLELGVPYVPMFPWWTQTLATVVMAAIGFLCHKLWPEKMKFVPTCIGFLCLSPLGFIVALPSMVILTGIMFALLIIVAAIAGFCLILRIIFEILKFAHSYAAVLCAAYAMIGAIVGHQYENPILGGVVGAIVGIATHELVSVRLLKLATR